MEKSSQDSTMFSTFDGAFIMNLVALYFYDQVLDVNILQKSLDDVVGAIPVLSSVVRERKIEGTSEKLPCPYYFEHVQSNNVKMKVVETDEDIYNNFQGKGVLDFKEGAAFRKYFESVEMDGWTKPAIGVPVVKITLINCNDKLDNNKKKTMLAVSMNHGLVDAHSLIYFMNRFSQGESFKVKNFSLDRSRLLNVIDKNFDVMKQPEEVRKACFTMHPFLDNPTPKDEVGFNFLKQEEVVRKYILFTKERIEEMKKEVRSSLKEEVKFSSLDCVSAHLWKISALFGCNGKLSEKMNQEVPFLIVINFRNRITGISENYFGNAIYSPGIIMTRKEVIESSISYLVLKIRKLIESTSDKYIDFVVNCSVKYSDLIKTGKSLKRTAVYVNDWRLFDFMKPHFGDVKCVRGIFSPPDDSHGLKSNQMMYVHLADEGGLNVKISVLKEMYEKIKEYDLTDSESFKKIHDLLY